MNCPYCDNERINDNDLSILTLGYNIQENVRLCSISDNDKPSRITVEIFKNGIWNTIITYYPCYCKNCGRLIIDYIDTDSFN